jgi:uncharacterized protein
MGQPVVHFEVVGKDGEKLQHYYAELFGVGDYDGHVTFYVEVPDVGAALRQAESLGGTE